MIHHNAGKKKPYHVDIRVEIDGKQVRLRKSFYTRRLADDWINIQKADALRGTLKIIRKKDRVSLRQAADRVLSDLRKRHAPGTIARYMNAINLACDIFGPNYNFDDIDRRKIQDFIDQRRKDGFNPRSINQDAGMICKVMVLAAEHFKTRQDWRPPRFERLHQTDRGRKRTLSNDEFEKLMKVLRGRFPAVADAVLLCRNTGGRYSEVLSLSWDDVTFDHPDYQFGALRLVGKDKQVRVVPMTEAAAELLRRRRDEVDGCSMWVFPSPKCAGHHLFHIRAQLCTAAKDAGVPYGRNITNGFVFHDIRRTAVTIARQAGMRIEDAASMFGHTPSVMLDVYSQPEMSGVARTAATLNTGVQKSVQATDVKSSEIRSVLQVSDNADE